MGGAKSLSISNKQKGRGYSFFLAILPIIMAYRFPFIGMGASTILIAIGLIPATLIIAGRWRYIQYPLVFLLGLFLIYVATKSSGSNVLLPLAILIHITAISTGAVNVSYLRKYIEGISLLAAACVIMQQFIHLITGFHVPLMNSNWLIDNLQEYSANIATGRSNEMMYRPCAFFLEPSHFSQYVIYGLGSCLYYKIPSFKKAILISLGLFATTSGMGFVLTFFIWGWWFLFLKYPQKKRSVSKILGLSVIAYLFYRVLNMIPFFSSIINRFTNDGDGDYNAIDGRLIYWTTLFGDKGVGDLVFGFGEEAMEDVYYTGFMKVLYAYGIIGTTLFYVTLLYLLYKVNTFARLYMIIYIALLFFANLTGFISIIFNIGLIIVFSYISNDTDLQNKYTRVSIV